MKSLFKMIKKLLSLLILAGWTALWLYPGYWHIVNVNSNAWQWGKMIGSTDEKFLPFTDLFHRLQYPNHNATWKNKPERISWNNLAKIDMPDGYGYTMLGYASALNNPELVGSFLIKGANPDAPCKDLVTPLLFAARNNHQKNSELLMKFKAQPDIADIKGETALHYAARHGISVIILEANSSTTSFDCTDKKGRTPIDWAIAKNNLPAVIELAMAGASPQTSAPNASPLINAYLSLCKKFDDPVKAARILAEKNSNEIIQKLNSRYNLPAELPVDMH
jgi:ankyrin repeat protein